MRAGTLDYGCEANFLHDIPFVDKVGCLPLRAAPSRRRTTHVGALYCSGTADLEKDAFYEDGGYPALFRVALRGAD